MEKHIKAMRRIFSISILVTLVGLFSACSWEQDYPELKAQAQVYEYQPDQPTIVEVEVIPMGDVELFFDDMVKETNADYMNRYGIGVKFTLGERQPLPKKVLDGYIFTPDEKSDQVRKITSYVFDKEYFNVMRAVGYAAIGYAAIVIRADGQRDRTTAHEIAHILGLKHVDIDYNVMEIEGGIGMYGEPNNFVPQQVDTMLTAIETNTNLYKLAKSGHADKINQFIVR